MVSAVYLILLSETCCKQTKAQTQISNTHHVRVVLYLHIFVVFCRSSFVLFLLSIVLSGLSRFTASDYPFGVFKLFMH